MVEYQETHLTLPLFLRLPLELSQGIYDYLLPKENLHIHHERWSELHSIKVCEWEASKETPATTAVDSILGIYQHTHLDILNFLLCGSTIEIRIEKDGYHVLEPRVDPEDVAWFKEYLENSDFNRPTKMVVRISSSPSHKPEELISIRRNVEAFCEILKISKDVSQLEIEPAGRECNDPHGSYYHWATSMNLASPDPKICKGELRYTFFPGKREISDLELVLQPFNILRNIKKANILLPPWGRRQASQLPET